ncbi:MAG: hypothetical protein A2252_11695 [Elusimicrobia bacterium RIFOXYA2_FULL_39_19]|nr:MAG: hypothetical protein A2252_11695 [Elusimicrobia bacterium RIFOXYA2_FULL_39_19]
MFKKVFKNSKKDIRPSCICYHCLPAGEIGRLGGGIVEIKTGGVSYSCAHKAWRQVFFILDGNGWLVLDAKKRCRVSKNMVVEIPYDTEHKIIADKNNSLRYLFINDYSQPVLKNKKSAHAQYIKIKRLVKKDLHNGEAKMIDKEKAKL